MDSDVEEVPRAENINVWSVSKKESAFVGRKINIPFDFSTKDKRRLSVRCLIDTGACASVLPFVAVKRLGFGERDLVKGIGEPETLSGFNGSGTNTLGTIKLRVKLGKTEREIPFIVVPDCLSGSILGMPALSAFGVNICPRRRTISF